MNTRHSLFARLRPVPLTAVSLADEFWAPRLRLNRQITLPSQYQLLESTGRLDNFRRAAGHLIQAAIAHYRATGSERLLRVARRLADHIHSVLGSSGYKSTSF